MRQKHGSSTRPSMGGKSKVPQRGILQDRWVDEAKARFSTWNITSSVSTPTWPSAHAPLTCRTIFLVDQTYTDRWGTDQRRQRVEAANFQDAQSEKGLSRRDLFNEEAHSTKPRWLKLSETKTPD